MEKWVVSAKRADFQQIAKQFAIDQVTARLIRNRDIIGEDAIYRYLHPSLEDLYPSSLLKGASDAAALLKRKIAQGRKIRVIGDYDIDGVNATFILLKGLKRCGAVVDYEIPDRMKDGFGLNRSLIELAFDEGADTIITCDNGIAAIDEVAYAKELGLTVIVTDHHEPVYEEKNGIREYRYPPAEVLVDPSIPEDTYPFRSICGAVVAWKVIGELFALFQIPEEEWMDFLPFAAFATVGDVMDLKDENRIIVRCGLPMLEHTQNKGMRALIAACQLTDKHLTAFHIGFQLGPCINAGGRLNTAKRALEMLLCEDSVRAQQLAQELCALNEQRKQMTEDGVRAACAMIDRGDFYGDFVYVIYLKDCHESIAGIIAGRVRERSCRPVIILTDAQVPGMLKGSGRSIECWSMYDGLVKCDEYLEKYGGHTMAAGLSLQKKNLEPFRRALNAQSGLTEEDLVRKVLIDVPMPVGYINEKLIGELEYLEPFGKGNEKPVFADKNLRFRSLSILGKNKNVLKFRLEGQGMNGIEAMYFGDPDEMLRYLTDKFGADQVERLRMGRPNRIMLSVLYYPSVNEYRGQRTLQIVINGYR